MVPSRDFWAYFALFIFVAVFFLDSKYILHVTATVLLSIIISWIINGDNLLPLKTDPNFVPEIVLRCICITFASLMMFLITFVVERLLVKELETIAEYDTLTLLKNRRTLNDRLDEAIQNYNKNGETFCFLMADIDDFKIVNDTYGHPFGDIVLKNIANIFLKYADNKHHVFRYGGEEVCAILYMSLDEAVDLAEKIRLEVSQTVHTRDDIKVKVTMSFGIVEYKNGYSKEDLTRVADTNLYYGKNHGKNTVVC